MSWTEASTMSQRLAFVRAATAEGANLRALCRQYGVSPRTGYKWLSRYRSEGPGGLLDRSRCPRNQPRRTSEAVEDAVVAVRQQHPAWGGRKIGSVLKAEFGSQSEAGKADTSAGLRAPSASTIGAILKRRGCIADGEAERHRAFVRFEHETPNALWQMDFKGGFALSGGERCYPLGVLDDCSRYCLALQACADQRAATVQEHLTSCFRENGLPERMLMDNGPPWCNPRPGTVGKRAHTHLSVWLMRLGIVVLHGRPWHPQTQGKEERFHRTLRAEVLEPRFAYNNFKVKSGAHGARGQGICAADLAEHRQVQALFDPWRRLYNDVRPHEAIGLVPPSSRYRKSPRAFPEELPPIEYETQPGDRQLRVNANGDIHLPGRTVHVGDAFYDQPLLLKPVHNQPETWQIYFCKQRIGQVSLREPTELTT